MDPLLGIRPVGMALPSRRPAVPGIIRLRSRPPRLLSVTEAVGNSESAPFGQSIGGGCVRVARGGTPAYSPFQRLDSYGTPTGYRPFETGGFGFAGRYASGTASDGSTRYSAEGLNVAFAFPGTLGITGFETVVSTQIVAMSGEMSIAYGFRNQLSAGSVDLVSRFSTGFHNGDDDVWLTKTLLCVPGSAAQNGPDPTLWFNNSGSSTSGRFSQWFVHYFKLFYD